MKKKRAVVFVLLAGILWGSLGITVRVLSSLGLSAIQIVVCRFIGAAVVLLLCFGVADRKKLYIEKKDIKYFIVFGLFGFLFYHICYTVTIQLTSLSIAVALLYTSPIWAMLVSIPVFHEQLTKTKGMAIFLSFLGCGMMSGVLSGGLEVVPLGILTGLLAGIGYGSYGVFAKILIKKYHAWTVTFYVFLISSVGGFFICHPKELAITLFDNPVIILYILIASIVCFVIPFGIYNLALNDIEASRAAVIVSIEPVMATIFGVVIYKETLSVPIIIGMCCVLAAIFILNKRKEYFIKNL
ncbi:MAG: DMT family transporter [Lachnospiraceae bacterium]